MQPEAVAPTETELRSERIASSGRAGPKRCSDAIEKGLAQFAEGQYEDAIDMFTHALELPGKGFVRLAGAAHSSLLPCSRRAVSRAHSEARRAASSRCARDVSLRSRTPTYALPGIEAGLCMHRCVLLMSALPADSTREHACPSEGEERAALYNMACCYAQLEEVDSGLSVLQGLLENGFDDYDTLRTDEDIAPLRAEADFEALLSKAEQRGKGFFGQRKRQRGRGLLDRW